jgi:hypothetical protein
MKYLLRLAFCASFSVQPLLAQFATDNFAGSGNWNVGTPAGSGSFAFNNRLDYLVSPATVNDGITATWQPASPAPYGADWSVVVDLHLLAMTLNPPSKSVYLNLVVSDKDNAANYMKVYQFRTWGGSAMEGFDSELYGSGNLTGYAAYLSSAATDSALMISFDSTTKMLSTYVGTAPGYAWTALQSVDIGSGTYQWGTGGFTIQLAAASASMGGTLTFAPGDAYFGNFAVAPTAIPEPAAYAAGLGALALLAVGLQRRFRQQ